MSLTCKRILGCIGVLVCIAVMVMGLNSVLRPTDADASINAIKTFHTLPEDTVEVIAYGSSHAWRGLAAMEMYESYGIGAYNYGTNWQKINTTELFFQDSLITQSPKVVLIETYNVGRVLSDTDVTAEIYYTRELAMTEEKLAYLSQCLWGDLERYASYFIPVVAFHENWVNIGSASFSEPSATEYFLENMGAVNTSSATSVVVGDYTTFTQKELGSASLAILDEIVETCAANDIELIFYTAPYQGEYNYSDAMTQYAAENDCVYLDLFQNLEETGINGETDFSDSGHLNASGAERVANYLGQYIVEHYDVTDMRTIVDNLWAQYAD